MTHLGVSPRYFSTIQAAGIVPRKIPGLEKLQLTTSTGMVLPTSFFRWFYSDVGFPSHVHLANISGGTDIAGAFTDGNPLDPIYESGGCQCASLGMDVKVFDSTMESMDGEPIVGKEVAVGKPGDLVCVKSFPNMPIKFWGDEGGKKYRGAYFERFDSMFFSTFSFQRSDCSLWLQDLLIPPQQMFGRTATSSSRVHLPTP